MSGFNDEEAWNLLNKFDFVFDSNLSDDLLCSICKNILHIASQNICGCRYCYHCIEKYLNGNEKFCPKNIGNCKKLINFNRDITIDHFANKKILSIKVKCPELFCQFSDSLIVMADHMKSHSIKCPYAEVGCIESRMDTHNIKDHLTNETYSHTNLLIESIRNLSNEINFLKENAIRNKEMIENLQIENIELQNEINMINIVKMEMKTLQDGMKELKNDSQQKNKLIYEMMRKNSNEQILIEKRLKSLEEINEGNLTNTKFYAPFEWKIENISQLIDQSKLGNQRFTYSQSFYSHVNGYKMRLYIDPYGYQINEYAHLVVYFVVVNGEYDDVLDWPMNKLVTIGLVDQILGSIYVKESFKANSIDRYFKAAFDRPSQRSPDDIDYCQSVLINLKVLLNNPKLVMDGSIFLKCFVD